MPSRYDGLWKSILEKCAVFKTVERRPLVGGLVGLVADKSLNTVETGEDHTVTAVVTGQQGGMIHGPGTLKIAFGSGQGFHIAVLVETGPDAGQLAVPVQ